MHRASLSRVSKHTMSFLCILLSFPYENEWRSLLMTSMLMTHCLCLLYSFIVLLPCLGLLKKSKENKAKNDQDRLDRFYKKEFAINKLLGTEVLPEACDPRVSIMELVPLLIGSCYTGSWMQETVAYPTMLMCVCMLTYSTTDFRLSDG